MLSSVAGATPVDRAAIPTLLPTCIECSNNIDEKDDQCRLSCGHLFHLQCYLKLYVVHGVSHCFRCNPIESSIKSGKTSVLLNLDFGTDANIRRMTQQFPVMPASSAMRATFTDAQVGLKPIQSEVTIGKTLKDQVFLAPMIKAAHEHSFGPEVSHTLQNGSDHVRDALRRQVTSKKMAEMGITIDHVVGAGITWQQWRKLHYGIQDAVNLGARWCNILSMGFGKGLVPFGASDVLDLQLLRKPPLLISFEQLFYDVFDNNYKALAFKRLSAELLSALGMQWGKGLQLRTMTHEDLENFAYLSLKDISTHLNMTRDIFIREKFSFDWLANMKWTVEQLNSCLSITTTDMQALYGSRSIALVPSHLVHDSRTPRLPNSNGSSSSGSGGFRRG
jgi:hypothetical protein